MVWRKVRRFLQEHCTGNKPLILGYSGGPDSKALLQALLASKEALKLDLHLAHVDHGWRKESADEADLLRQEAAVLGLPFHLKRLPTVPSKNKEAFARQERLEFFSKLCGELQAEGVFLAHHADDLAETVLKRVLEGAHLRAFGGMEEVSESGQMLLFRPLLSFSKKELLQSIGKAPYLEDATNLDPGFLRGRMRGTLLPFLNQTFGKEVSRNLCRLSQSSLELKKYFAKRIKKYEEAKQDHSWGVLWDFSRYSELEKVELEYLLKGFFQRNHWTVSSVMFEGIISGLLGSKRKIFYQSKGVVFYIDNSILFIIKEYCLDLFLSKLNNDKLF